jgi:hypothetical protein
VSEAERLRSDNLALSRRLLGMKEKEIERMNEINKLHEEMVGQRCMRVSYMRSDWFFAGRLNG